MEGLLFSPACPPLQQGKAISIASEAEESCYLIPWPPRQHPAEACSTHPPGQFITAPFSFWGVTRGNIRENCLLQQKAQGRKITKGIVF